MREQDRDVGRDAERRTGIEECPVLSHDRVGLRDLHDQAALGTARTCHGGTIDPAKTRQPSGFAPWIRW
jgi:hypothetical protein